MLGSAESEHPRLTKCEIIFEDFQPIDHDPQRHGQTTLPWQYRALRSIAR